MFPKIVVPPKSSILIWFSIINHPFGGTPTFFRGVNTNAYCHGRHSHLPFKLRMKCQREARSLAAKSRCWVLCLEGEGPTVAANGMCLKMKRFPCFVLKCELYPFLFQQKDQELRLLKLLQRQLLRWGDVNFHQLETPKNSHSCLTKMVLSYDFQVGAMAILGTLEQFQAISLELGMEATSSVLPADVQIRKKCLWVNFATEKNHTVLFRILFLEASTFCFYNKWTRSTPAWKSLKKMVSNWAWCFLMLRTDTWWFVLTHFFQ